MIIQPKTLEELQTLLHENKKLFLRGAGTKSALSTVPAETVSLDMRGFNGIIEYQPGEFTFTAYAGTPLSTIVNALAEHGQYLPFDPLLVQKGATLGGTVATNASGSGRWRYGGVRDFILGIRFVDGMGRYVRSGGKVVKNAAGFDLPKFFVGSCGYYGILVEMSFKVFPQPQRFVTLKISYPTIAQAVEAIFALMLSPLETDAVDIEGQHLLIRLSGLEASLPRRVERLKAFLGQNTAPASLEIIEHDTQFWQSINNLEWINNYQSLIKVPISPRKLAAFEAAVQARIPDSKRHYTSAGNVAWIALNDSFELASILNENALAGLKLIGTGTSPFLRNLKGQEILHRLKQVLDPQNIFWGMNNATQD